MTMPLVSIIIPCYNVAAFMKKCLDTVCAQTLRDIEIICINDGSTDGTPDILREYEAADERIRIIDQPNAGVAAARNAGLDAACGKYIGFADPERDVAFGFVTNTLGPYVLMDPRAQKLVRALATCL